MRYALATATVVAASVRPSTSDETATMVKPGVRRSARAASRRSRVRSSIQIQPHTSRDASRNRSGLPNRAGSAIISRCAAISRANAASNRRRFNRYQTRRTSSPNVFMAGVSPSRRLEDGDDGLCRAGEVLPFDHELLLAVRRQSIFAYRAPRLGYGGAGLDPSLEQETLQRGIERSFFDAQLSRRQHGDALGDRVSVQRLGGQHAQNEHGQGSWRQSVDSRHSCTMPSLGWPERGRQDAPEFGVRVGGQSPYSDPGVRVRTLTPGAYWYEAPQFDYTATLEID